MSEKVVRQACTGCGRSLKIKIEQMPEEDFAIQCPKCGTEVGVRLDTVRAALAADSAAPPVGVFQDKLPPMPHLGGDSEEEEEEKPRGRGGAVGGIDPQLPRARDITNDFIARDGREGVTPGAPRSESSVSARRMTPRNAPRTSPPPRGAGLGGIDLPLPLPVLGGIAGGVVFLLLVLVLVFAGGGGGGENAASESADDAIRDEIAALKASVGDPEGEAADLFVKGLELFRGDTTQEHIEAHAMFRRSVAADPNHPEPLGALSLNSIFLPKSDRGIGVTQANKWADYVQRQMPESVHGGIARAALLNSLGRDAEAKTLALEQTQKHSSNALAWFIHGHVLRKSDPKTAAASLRKALAADPGFRLARTELAAAELAQGRIRAAQEVLAQRKNEGPMGGNALAVEAAIAAKLGDDAQALELLTKAVEWEPKNAELRLELAWRLVSAGDPARALTHTEHVIKKLAPAEDASGIQAAEAQLAASAALRLSGRGKEAASAAQQGARAHPSKGFAQYHLGLALLAAGRMDEAGDAMRWERWRGSPEAGAGRASSGWMRTATSTRPRRPPRATSTGCRSPSRSASPRDRSRRSCGAQCSASTRSSSLRGAWTTASGGTSRRPA